jgi:hypothetical protein
MTIRPRENSVAPATVTVVISCYNYGRYLRQSVQSAVSQDGVHVDVIIVDDASTDNSVEVARELAAIHTNVKVLAHEDNQGVVKTFNDGARAATGEFLVRLDADDLLTPGSLKRSVRLARAYPTLGLVYGHPLHFDGDSLPHPRLDASAWTVWPGRDWLRDRCRSGVNVISSPEVLMRRSVLEQIGYQAPLKHTHDMELWFRFAAFTDIAYIHGADQAWHREHSGSLSAREVDELVDLRERREAFDVLFDGPAGGVKGAATLRREATQALLNESITTARHELDRGAGASPLFTFCLELAQELDPSVVRSSVWRRLNRRAEVTDVPPWTRFGSLARRGLARAASELRWWNWHRNGVF